jgi:hypothetical protein
MKPSSLVVVAASLFASLAFAQEPGRGPGHGPPPEALAACASLIAGATCSVSLHGQTLAGTCVSPPGGSALACRPTNPPPMTPPPEAVSACAQRSANDACAFSLGGTNLTGTCATPPGSSTLACRPAHGPGGPHGPPPAESLEACASSSADAACSFSMGGNTLTGTCVTPPGSSTLACRPNHPPGEQRGPPAEAITACSGRAAEASCSFTHDGRSLTGTCGARPPEVGSAGPLACRPAR